MTGDFMTTSDLAERLKTPQSTVRYWRYTGYGPPGLKVGRRVLYRVTDVEAWLKSLGSTTGARK